MTCVLKGSLHFIETLSIHSNMSLNCRVAVRQTVWRSPLVPAEGSVAQQSITISLFKVECL